MTDINKAKAKRLTVPIWFDRLYCTRTIYLFCIITFHAMTRIWLDKCFNLGAKKDHIHNASAMVIKNFWQGLLWCCKEPLWTVCYHLLHSEHVGEFIRTHPHTDRTIEALCKCAEGAVLTAVCNGYIEAWRKEATRRGLVSGRLMQPQLSSTLAPFLQHRMWRTSACALARSNSWQ